MRATGALHPAVEAAARGELPGWARMTRERKAHAARVAELLDAWADEAGLDARDRDRWVAAGWLHDCLKDEDEDALQALLPDDLAALPGPVLHGPAAAERLRAEGVDDEELLGAVAWHTLGHPGFGRLGRVLYAADFLEPGRKRRRGWRASLRERLPDDLDGVVREILAARIGYLLEEGRPILPETVGFWNLLAGGDAWARASEV